MTVEPGSHGDVLLGGHGAEAQSSILSQDIELASFVPQPGIVTLLASPDAKRLAIAADRGGVQVVLHH